MFPITIFYSFLNGGIYINEIIFSLFFLLVNILVLFVYVSLKLKKQTNIFKHYFGWGDLLFLIAIIPLFSTQNYILFFISGMLLSMLFHLTLNRFQKHLNIPLAGYLSLYLSALLVFAYFNPSLLKSNLL
jgi:hypothetical protein